jgi:hypothetical protein
VIKILHESWNQNLLGFKSISGLVEKIRIESLTDLVNEFV